MYDYDNKLFRDRHGAVARLTTVPRSFTRRAVLDDHDRESKATIIQATIFAPQMLYTNNATVTRHRTHLLLLDIYSTWKYFFVIFTAITFYDIFDSL